MGKINNIIVFSTGDPGKVSTWSNVPFLFTETLISQGIEVKRVHVKEIAILTFAYRVIKKILLLAFRFPTTFEYSRSVFHFYYSKWFMEKVLRENDHDAVLILSCSYAPAKFSKKPIILFCDWNYEYYLEYFLDRKPDWFERSSVNRENSVIECADYVFVLFPVVYSYMLNKYTNKNIYYLGNVINSVEQSKIENLEWKKQSSSILFVGKEHYLEGAKQLIDVFAELRKEIPDLELDIIGMGESFFSDLPAGVNCHGYLDKGNELDRKLYYELLMKAKVFVNTTPKWASFSAILEAMYFFTPVITTPYREFVKTFGERIDFGYFYKGIHKDDLVSLIRNVFSTPDYEILCTNSHAAVKDFTWDSYVKKFMDVVNGCEADNGKNSASNCNELWSRHYPDL